jgi:hypothetical protein
MRLGERYSQNKTHWNDPFSGVIKFIKKAMDRIGKYYRVPYIKKSRLLPISQTPEQFPQLHNRHYFNHIEYSPWPYYISIWTSALIFFFLAYLNKYSSVQPYMLLLLLGGLFIQIER